MTRWQPQPLAVAPSATGVGLPSVPCGCGTPIAVQLVGHAFLALPAQADLVRDLERAYQVRRTENLAASNELCSQLENTCEELLDAMQVRAGGVC